MFFRPLQLLMGGLLAAVVAAGTPAWGDDSPPRSESRGQRVRDAIRQAPNKPASTAPSGNANQPPKRTPAASPPADRAPRSTGSPPVINRDAVRERLQQSQPKRETPVPRSNPGAGTAPNAGNRSDRPSLPNLPRNPQGNDNAQQMRERLEQSTRDRGSDAPRPPRGPQGDDNAQRLRERLEQSTRDRGSELPKLPRNTQPGDENRGPQGDRQPRLPGDVSRDVPRTPGRNPQGGDMNRDRLREQLESRKPVIPSNNNNTPNEAERLRNRLKDMEGRPGDKIGGSNLNPGRPRDAQPGDGRGKSDNGPGKIDLTRRPGRGSDLKVERNAFDRDRPGRMEQARVARDIPRIRNVEDLNRGLERFRDQGDVRNVLQRTSLQINDFSGAFQSRIRNDNDRNFQRITKTDFGRKYDIDRQFRLAVNGDVSRQMNFNTLLIQNGGWRNRVVGPVYSQYTSVHFSSWYPGPSWYPSYCWTPRWSPWVAWSFWDYCRPVYDPRPFVCRPIYYYDPCPPIVYYEYPVWQPLPVVTCGTWVDVPYSVTPSGYDLQLLAVRFVDPGHPDENLGPRYRVWLRNNSPVPVQSPFNVLLLAANSPQFTQGVPEAGVTVDTMEPGAVVPVDIRLPMEANRMHVTESGQRTPFTNLHVLVDSHRELAENDETNNGLVIHRDEILPVDPAAFSTDEPATFSGQMVSLAGEGFGPEPGQLIVTMGDRQIPAEIHGWYDLGVYFKMPNLPVTGDTKAEVLVIRGDGAASNPVAMDVSGMN